MTTLSRLPYLHCILFIHTYNKRREEIEFDFRGERSGEKSGISESATERTPFFPSPPPPTTKKIIVIFFHHVTLYRQSQIDEINQFSSIQSSILTTGMPFYIVLSM